jgi:hypothetical protein
MPLSKFTRLTGVLFASQLLATAAQAGEPIHIGFEGGQFVEDIFTFEGYEFATWNQFGADPSQARAGQRGLLSPMLPSNESASIILTVNAEQGDIISFWLKDLNFDEATLSFFINNQEQGNWTPNWDGTPSVWKRHAYTAPSTGELTLRWQVSSPNGTNETFAIDDIRVYTRNAQAGNRDVNGDGTDEFFVVDNSGFVSTQDVNNEAIFCDIRGNNVSAIGDFNGDGVVESASVSSSGSSDIFIDYSCQGTLETGDLAWRQLLGAADLNGDKIDDFISYDGFMREVHVQFVDKSIANDSSVLFNIPPEQEILSMSDFNSDSIADVLTNDDSGLLTLYAINSDLSHSVHTLFALNPLLFTAPLSDIDGNGTTDIVQYDWFGNIEITYMDSVTEWHTVKSRSPLGWLPRVAGDFDADGIANDYILMNPIQPRSSWKDDIARASYLNDTWGSHINHVITLRDSEYLYPKSDPYIATDWSNPVPVDKYSFPKPLLSATDKPSDSVQLLGDFNNETPSETDYLQLFTVGNNQAYMGRLSVDNPTTLTFAVDEYHHFGSNCNNLSTDDLTPQPLTGIVSSSACLSGATIPWSVPAGDYLVEFAYNQSKNTAKAVLRPYTGKTDIDGDGLSDEDEINLYQTDPYNADEDFDNVVDGAEILLFNSNTQSFDSDNDGESDRREVDFGTSLISADTDNDGLTDFQEINETFTDPTNSDTDGDGYSDGIEINNNTSPTDAFWFPIVRFDQNGDGLADILWRNESTGDNWFYGMNGHQVAVSQGLVNVPLNWELAGRGDFNSDGKSDILWRNLDTGENYIYFMNGNAIERTEFVSTVPANAGWIVAGIGDFDGDRFDDILWRNTSTGQIWLYTMIEQHIHNSAQVALISDLNWQINNIADLNGDGKDDILLRHAGNGTVWKYIMNGSTITSSGKVMSAGSNWKLMVTADFDGDNDADLLWRDTDSGRNYVYLLDNGVVNWNNRGQISKFTDQLWVPVMAGDFDGDGDDDIFWHHFGNGQNYLYLMNGKQLDLKYVNTISDTNWVPAN